MSAPHPLDNPAWNALTNQHSHFARGDHLARRYDPEVAVFAAVAANDEDAFVSLAQVVTSGEYVGLFGRPPKNEESWVLIAELSVNQMVYEGPIIESVEGQNVLKPLSHADVPLMLELIELTHPGPFFRRTIELGGYVSIWQEGKLAAMAGNRLHLPRYREISAVCTHPDFQKRGYARQLVLQLVHNIQSAGDVPFLHVAPENTGAISLYKALGFKQRAELPIFVLKRQ